MECVNIKIFAYALIQWRPNQIHWPCPISWGVRISNLWPLLTPPPPGSWVVRISYLWPCSGSWFARILNLWPCPGSWVARILYLWPCPGYCGVRISNTLVLFRILWCQNIKSHGPAPGCISACNSCHDFPKCAQEGRNFSQFINKCNLRGSYSSSEQKVTFSSSCKKLLKKIIQRQSSLKGTVSIRTPYFYSIFED